ncbi:MAG: DUF2339 domain-containing protein [Vicinamibacterales bacterium]
MDDRLLRIEARLDALETIVARLDDAIAHVLAEAETTRGAATPAAIQAQASPAAAHTQASLAAAHAHAAPAAALLETVEDAVTMAPGALRAVALAATPAVAAQAGAAQAAAALEPAPPAAAVADGATAEGELLRWLTFAGRTLMAFGGAFLLRALTEAGRLTPVTGIAFGLLYAAGWYVAADRAGRRGHRLSAVFHGLTGALVALPLVVEAAARFHVLGPRSGAALLATITLVSVGIAATRGLQSLAAIGVLGATFVGPTVASLTGGWAWMLVTCTGLVLVAWWLSEARAWPWVKWPLVPATLFVALGLGSRAMAVPPLDAPPTAVAAHLVFVTMTVGAFAYRAVARSRRIQLFEVVVAAMALALGLGLALAEVDRMGAAGTLAAIGLASALGSSAGYALALAVVGRREGRGPTYYFLTSVALVLLVVACGALLDGAALASTSAAIALVLTWLGSTRALPTLTLHGAVLATASAVISGLLAMAVRVWTGDGDGWPDVDATSGLAFLAGVACLVIPRPVRQDRPALLAAVGRGLIAALVAVAAGGLVVRAVAPLVAGTPPAPGPLATTRTVILSVSVLLLALAARWPRTRELGWLVYPALAIGAIKFVAEDVWRSSPSTLFLALAAYGAALVVGPRLARR